MQKRTLSILILIAMLLAYFPASALADPGGTIWSGQCEDFFLLDDDLPNSGENPYIIDTADKLAMLSQKVNSGDSFEGEHFRLTANLDLDDLPWTPIGYKYDNSFNGIFDGANHTVRGLYVYRSGATQTEYSGLFGVVKDNGVIKNLRVVGEVYQDLTSYANSAVAGGVAGAAIGNPYENPVPTPVIDGCSFTGDVNAIGIKTKFGDNINGLAGGIVGRAECCIIRNCSFISGEIHALTQTTSGTSNAIAGGIVGTTYATDIMNCYTLAQGSVSAYDSTMTYAGGILGRDSEDSFVGSCYNAGSVYSQVNPAGGVCGNLGPGSSVSHVFYSEECGADYAIGNPQDRRDYAGKMPVDDMTTASFCDSLNDSLDDVADSHLYFWTHTPGEFPVLSGAFWGSVTITQLVIEDPIAPINGEAPVTTLKETAEYTGSIQWEGDPDVFAPDTLYTATITLTPKKGYTVRGVDEDDFVVPCAKSAANEKDSGVITVTFMSPPAGYVTDGNGKMAYRLETLRGFDIMGTFNGLWALSTVGGFGFQSMYKISNGESQNIDFSTGDINLKNGMVMRIRPVLFGNGNFVRVIYTLENTGSQNVSISFGSFADIKIGDDDHAPITKFEDGRGFKMVNGRPRDFEGAEFNFYGKQTAGVIDVDTFWFGFWNPESPYLYTQVEDDSFSDGDSMMAYSWQNLNFIPGQRRLFSVLIGIGDAESGINLPIGVNFDSRGGTEVDTILVEIEGDSIYEPTAPGRSGYTFAGWYCEEDLINLFDFTTPINSTITLYAKWSKNPSIKPEVYVSPRYTVNCKIPEGLEGGEISFSREIISEGGLVLMYVSPYPGFVAGLPSVRTVFDQSVSLHEYGEGIFGFWMPMGGVTVEVDFQRLSYFDDVKEHDWFHGAAWFCAANELMNGTGYRIFDGSSNTTRATLVTTLHRLHGGEDGFDNKFSDVELGMWYSDAIGWAARNGIEEGYGDGRFGPDDALTREQMACILHRYFGFVENSARASHGLMGPGSVARSTGLTKFAGSTGLTGFAALAEFADLPAVSHWALDSVNWAVGTGIIEGMGANLLSPGTHATRAQLASVMERFYSLLSP